MDVQIFCPGRNRPLGVTILMLWQAGKGKADDQLTYSQERTRLSVI